MTRTLFGTDGVRGTANTHPMTAETMLKLAMATALEFKRGTHRNTVVIGKDTRLSGYMLEPALTAGFISMGMDVVLLGPIPTPAVAALTRSLRADLGVMISASHNPHEDNGVKLFGPDGFKLSDTTEQRIEARMNEPFEAALAPADGLGRARRVDDALGRSIESLKNTLPRNFRLDGLKVVIDCAHGAAYKLAPQILWELGAEVVALHTHPDGLNINLACGALHPHHVQKAVKEHQADIGFALDGDADRLIVVDEQGKVIQGDQILALMATHAQAQGTLQGGLVATVMSSLGLAHYCEAKQIPFIRSQVGDRYVVERMRAHGFNIGGESSGHIVLAHHSTTGDGVLAALHVLAAMKDQQQKASIVCSLFEPVPQFLQNIRLTSAKNPLEDQQVMQHIQDIEAELAGHGRVLLRKSGTEPVIRVMVEAPSPDVAGKRLCAAILAAMQ